MNDQDHAVMRRSENQGIEHGEPAIRHNVPPCQAGQEWANALTHGTAAVATVLAAVIMLPLAWEHSAALAMACAVYLVSAFGTFLCSTLSHVVRRQPLLNTLRAWDQAMIYSMIAGTYTPIIVRYAPDSIRTALLLAIWIAAAIGFTTKVAVRHRINSISSLSYLLLGWLPALPLNGYVPSQLAQQMLVGGLCYSVGVVVLMNDWRCKYFHALWHLCVMAGAAVHYLTILDQVVLK